MKKIIKWGLFILPALMLMTSCDNGDGITGPREVTLTTDKLTIIADGVDAVTFTVMYGEEDVTDRATITNRITGQTHTGRTFTSTMTGAYIFGASYDDVRSENVSITVEVAPDNHLVIVPSKTKVLPDGTDYAVLMVNRGSTNVTDDARVKNNATGTYLEKVDGEFRVTTTTMSPVDYIAEYEDATSAVCTISATPFFKMLSVVKFTGTWCLACYPVDALMHYSLETHGDRMAILSLHGPNGQDDMSAMPECYEWAMAYQVSQWPTCLFDLSGQRSTGITLSLVNEMVEQSVERGAFSGIKATSTLEGRTATVDVTFKAGMDTDYSLVVMYMVDDVPGPQNGYTGGGDYYHQSVLRRTLTTGLTGEFFAGVKTDQEQTRQYTYTLEDETRFDPEKGRWYIYTTRKINDVTMADNLITCPSNGSVDYKYETE